MIQWLLYTPLIDKEQAVNCFSIHRANSYLTQTFAHDVHFKFEFMVTD